MKKSTWEIEDHGTVTIYTIISNQGGGFPNPVCHIPAYALGDIGRKRAQLIKAAPDMLKALKTAAVRLRTLCDADEATDNDVLALNEVERAIRKAEVIS